MKPENSFNLLQLLYVSSNINSQLIEGTQYLVEVEQILPKI